MADDWRLAACGELIELRGTGPAWPYRRGGTPAAEPTALAGLALLASSPHSGTVGADGGVAAAADWLVAIQRSEGALGLSREQPSPGWTTPYALLLWSALGGREPACGRASSWLLRQKGKVVPARNDPEHVVGHDTTLVGWPWVADTHSWLEPTALAVLALRKVGLGGHPRVEEGLRLVRDRAIAGGGWNYGNKAAFGRALRPQPGPTGLALLALAGAPGATRAVDLGIRYLTETLPETRAPASLGWGLLGLRAWDVRPPEAAAWLEEAYRRSTGRADAAMRLALLLLAAGDDSLEIFDGRQPSGGSR